MDICQELGSAPGSAISRTARGVSPGSSSPPHSQPTITSANAALVPLTNSRLDERQVMMLL